MMMISNYINLIHLTSTHSFSHPVQLTGPEHLNSFRKKNKLNKNMRNSTDVSHALRLGDIQHGFKLSYERGHPCVAVGKCWRAVSRLSCVSPTNQTFLIKTSNSCGECRAFLPLKLKEKKFGNTTRKFAWDWNITQKCMKSEIWMKFANSLYALNKRALIT